MDRYINFLKYICIYKLFFFNVKSFKFNLFQVKSKVDEFKEHMPLIQTLFNPGLRDRHWDQISELVGYNLRPDDTYCLSKFANMNLESYIPKFESISESASKEYSLEKAMENMKNEWAPVS